MHKATKLFWPLLITPKNANVKSTKVMSKSQRLMTELGLIKSASNGTFQIMPMGQRSLDKCITLLQRNMQRVGGQKITLPVLTSSKLWRKTGRLNGDITEFFMLRDRQGKEFLISPTHEEAVTALLAASAPISYKQLPLRLYQIGPKFRDELKSRFGLIRAKEFLMKDLYSFDKDATTAAHTYAQLSTAYANFFKQLEVPFLKVTANAGMMGGTVSHEYHYVSSIGEDVILQCSKCNYASNAESVGNIKYCPSCHTVELNKMRGMEVAHTFLLGDKYSKPLCATFLNEKGKPQDLMMGCYGIGITRVIAAALESLSLETELRWPKLLAPYDVCLIGPKEGSKEQQTGAKLENYMLNSVIDLCGVDEVLHDDRKYMTIGRRLMDAKRVGYPLILIIGAKSTQSTPKIELHEYDAQHELEPSEALSLVAAFKKIKANLNNSTAIILESAMDDLVNSNGIKVFKYC